MSAVMVIYSESFPTGYLVALAPAAAATAEKELAAHLTYACSSGKPTVWIDCRLLDTLSTAAVWLLWSCQQRLQQRRARLVLCRVPAAIERALPHMLAGTGGRLLLAPTLDDAATLP